MPAKCRAKQKLQLCRSDTSLGGLTVLVASERSGLATETLWTPFFFGFGHGQASAASTQTGAGGLAGPIKTKRLSVKEVQEAEAVFLAPREAPSASKARSYERCFRRCSSMSSQAPSPANSWTQAVVDAAASLPALDDQVAGAALDLWSEQMTQITRKQQLGSWRRHGLRVVQSDHQVGNVPKTCSNVHWGCSFALQFIFSGNLWCSGWFYVSIEYQPIQS